MSIEWKRCAVVDGKAYPSIEEAKLAMLVKVFACDEERTWTAEQAAGRILGAEDEVLNALTFTETSRPKARKVNGATRKPRKKDAALTLEA